MAAWEDVPSTPAMDNQIALDSDTLIVPVSTYTYACMRGERYVSLRVDAASQRLGLNFHEHPGNASVLALHPADCDSIWGAKAYVADASGLVSNYDWIRTVAEASVADLHKVPIAYSESDGMWIGRFPCVFPGTPVSQFDRSVTSESRGVLRVWHDNRIVAVSNCLLRGYVANRNFQRSAWTEFDYAIVADPLSRSYSAKWWRRYAEAIQGQPLEYPSLQSWLGECRSPEAILFANGWSSEAIEILVREMYDAQVGPGETILPEYLVEEQNESQTLDAQALIAELTPAEKVEAYKYYAIENGDYDDDPSEERDVMIEEDVVEQRDSDE
jgi:hypothetical protein